MNNSGTPRIPTPGTIARLRCSSPILLEVLLRRTGSRSESESKSITESPSAIVWIPFDVAHPMPSEEIHQWMREDIVCRCVRWGEGNRYVKFSPGFPRNPNTRRIPTDPLLITSRLVNRCHDYPDPPNSTLVASMESRLLSWVRRRDTGVCRMRRSDHCFGSETYSWYENIK